LKKKLVVVQRIYAYRLN